MKRSPSTRAASGADDLRQDQADAQWQRMLRNTRTHPFARYGASMACPFGAAHQRLNNVTLPVGDAWWHANRPPGGTGCRCRVVGVTQREYDAGQVFSRPGAALDRDAPIVAEPMIKRAPD